MRFPNLIRYASSTLNITGADALIGRKYKGRGAIFVFHSVVSDRREYLHDHLHMSQKFLDRLLSYYVSIGVDIISLDDALRRLQSSSTAPFVCFTFDDGYRDNITRALPVFERYGKPFTIYITTCFLTRTMKYWWGGLMEVIKANDCIELEFHDGIRRFDTCHFANKVIAYQIISRAVTTGLVPEAALYDLLKKYNVDIEDVLDQLAMTESELRVLARMPLVEIGAHTDSHPHLQQLDAEQVRQEMLTNKKYLEMLTERDVHHFAYPYGGRASCGEREFQIARDVGFRTASTTRFGCLFSEHLSHLTSLPRVRTFGQCESLHVVECARSGAFSALATRFGSPIVTN
jgi:peptidoglycan/xylan/chitin deacetylase (PgdA/CDA1 family)